MKIQGLHLWEVSLENSPFNLHVTTRTRSLKEAGKKAEKFLKTNKKHKDFKGALVDSVRYKGTLDG